MHADPSGNPGLGETRGRAHAVQRHGAVPSDHVKGNRARVLSGGDSDGALPRVRCPQLGLGPQHRRPGDRLYGGRPHRTPLAPEGAIAPGDPYDQRKHGPHQSRTRLERSSSATTEPGSTNASARHRVRSRIGHYRRPARLAPGSTRTALTCCEPRGRDGTSYRRSSSNARRRGLSFWSDEGGRVWSP